MLFGTHMPLRLSSVHFNSNCVLFAARCNATNITRLLIKFYYFIQTKAVRQCDTCFISQHAAWLGAKQTWSCDHLGHAEEVTDWALPMTTITKSSTFQGLRR